MEEFDYETARLYLRSEKATLRKQGRLMCELLFAKAADSSALPPSCVPGLLHAAVEFERLELETSSAKSKPIGLDVAQFLRQAVKFCLNSGVLLSDRVLPVVDHLVHVIGNLALPSPFRLLHKSLLLEFLSPRLFHSVYDTAGSGGFGNGIGQLIFWLRSALCDHSTRREQIDLKLLVSTAYCLFNDISTDVQRQYYSLLEALVLSESYQEGDGLAVLIACCECCALEIHFRGPHCFSGTFLAALNGLLFKLSGKLLGGVLKDSQMETIFQLLTTLYEAFHGTLILSHALLDLQLQLLPSLSSILESMLTDQFLVQLVGMHGRRANRLKLLRETTDGPLTTQEPRSFLAIRSLACTIAWVQTLSGDAVSGDEWTKDDEVFGRKKRRLTNEVRIWQRLEEQCQQIVRCPPKAPSSEADNISRSTACSLVEALCGIARSLLEWKQSEALLVLLRVSLPSPPVRAFVQTQAPFHLALCLARATEVLSEALVLLDSLGSSSATDVCAATLVAVLRIQWPNCDDWAVTRMEETLAQCMGWIASRGVKAECLTPQLVDLLASISAHPAFGCGIRRTEYKGHFEKWNWIRNPSRPFPASHWVVRLRVALSLPDHARLMWSKLGNADELECAQWTKFECKDLAGKLQLALQWSSQCIIEPIDQKDVVASIMLFLPETPQEDNSFSLPASWRAKLFAPLHALEVSALARGKGGQSASSPFRGPGICTPRLDSIASPFRSFLRLHQRQISQQDWVLALDRVECHIRLLQSSSASSEVRLLWGLGTLACVCYLLEQATLPTSSELQLRGLDSVLACCTTILNIIGAHCRQGQLLITALGLEATTACLESLCSEKALLQRVSLTGPLGDLQLLAATVSGVFHPLSSVRDSRAAQIAESEGAGMDGMLASYSSSKAAVHDDQSEVAMRSLAAAVRLASLALWRSSPQLNTFLYVDLVRHVSPIDCESKLSIAHRFAALGATRLARLIMESDDQWGVAWRQLGYCRVFGCILAMLDGLQQSQALPFAAHVQTASSEVRFMWNCLVAGGAGAGDQRAAYLQMEQLWLFRALRVRCLALALPHWTEIAGVKEVLATAFKNASADKDVRVRIVAAQNADSLLAHFRNPLKVYRSLSELPSAGDSGGSRCALDFVPVLLAVACMGSSSSSRHVLWKPALSDAVRIGSLLPSAPALEFSAKPMPITARMSHRIVRYTISQLTQCLGGRDQESCLLIHLEWLVFAWMSNEDVAANRTPLVDFPWYLFSSSDDFVDAPNSTKLLNRIVPVICLLEDGHRLHRLQEVCCLVYGGSSSSDIVTLLKTFLSEIKSLEICVSFYCQMQPALAEIASGIPLFLARAFGDYNSWQASRSSVSAIVSRMLRLSISNCLDILELLDSEGYLREILWTADGNSVSLSKFFPSLSAWFEFSCVDDMLRHCNLFKWLMAIKLAICSGGSFPGSTPLILAILTFLLPHMVDQPLLQRLLVSIFCLLLRQSGSVALVVMSSFPDFVRRMEDCWPAKPDLALEWEATMWDMISLFHVYESIFSALDVSRQYSLQEGGLSAFELERSSWDRSCDAAISSQDVLEQCAHSWTIKRGAAAVEHDTDTKLLLHGGERRSELLQSSFGARVARTAMIAKRYLSGCVASYTTYWVQMSALWDIMRRSPGVVQVPSEDEWTSFFVASMQAVQSIAKFSSSSSACKLLSIAADITTTVNSFCYMRTVVHVADWLPLQSREGRTTEATGQMEHLWVSVLLDVSRLSLQSESARDLALCEIFFGLFGQNGLTAAAVAVVEAQVSNLAHSNNPHERLGESYIATLVTGSQFGGYSAPLNWEDTLAKRLHSFLVDRTVKRNDSQLPGVPTATLADVVEIAAADFWSEQNWSIRIGLEAFGCDLFIRSLALRAASFFVHAFGSRADKEPVAHLFFRSLGVCMLDTCIAEKLFLLAVVQIAAATADQDMVVLLFRRIVVHLSASSHKRARQLCHRALTSLLQALSEDYKEFHKVLYTVSNQSTRHPMPNLPSKLILPMKELSLIRKTAQCAIDVRDCCSAVLLIELMSEWNRAALRPSSEVDMAVKQLASQLVESDQILGDQQLFGLDFSADLKLQALVHMRMGNYDRALCALESILACSSSDLSNQGIRNAMAGSLKGLGVQTLYTTFANSLPDCTRVKEGLRTWSIADNVLDEDVSDTELLLRLGDDFGRASSIATSSQSVLDLLRSVHVLSQRVFQMRLLHVEASTANYAFCGVDVLPATTQIVAIEAAISSERRPDNGRMSFALKYLDGMLDLSRGHEAHRLSSRIHALWAKVRGLLDVGPDCLSREVVMMQMSIQEAKLLWLKGFKDAALSSLTANVIEPFGERISAVSSKKTHSDPGEACRIFYCDALSTAGVWMTQKGYHSKEAVVDGRLLPALQLIREVSSVPRRQCDWWGVHFGVDSLRRREAQCHLAVANYFEQRFHNLNRKAATREWIQRRQHLLDRRVEYGQCMQLRDSCLAEIKRLDDSGLNTVEDKQRRGAQERLYKTTARHIIVLKREIDLDEKEEAAVLRTLKESLVSAVRHYLSVLELAPSIEQREQLMAEYVDVMFRVVSLWLSNAASAADSEAVSLDEVLGELNAMVLELLEQRKLPLHFFLPLHQQMLSRLGEQVGAKETPARNSLQITLQFLAIELAAAYPYHVLPSLFALLHNNVDSATATTAAGASIDTRLSAADITSAVTPVGAGDPRYGTRSGSGGCSTGERRQRLARSVLLDVHRQFQGCRQKENLVVGMQQALQQYILLAATNTQDAEQKGLTKQVKFSDIQPRGRRFHEQLKLILGRSGLSMLTAHMPVAPWQNAQSSHCPVTWLDCRDSFDMTENGISRPKIIACLGSDGKWYRQLVKGGDDLRQDAVMQQVFEAVNMTFRNIGVHDNEELRANMLRIRTYKVVPTSAQTGILEFVEHTLPFGGILCDAHPSGRSSNAAKKGLHTRHRPWDWTHAKCRDHFKSADAGSKLSRFVEIYANFHPVFRFFFLEQFRHPSLWFANRCNFVDSVAVNSMVGYVLGIGDRHAHNLLVDATTGEVVHIDFGIVFEQGQLLTIPETVPFRLTRDIVDGMGVQGTKGKFQRTCELVLSILRQQRENLMVILEVVMFDPLYKWSLSPLQMRGRQQFDNAVPTAENLAVPGHRADVHAAQPDVRNQADAAKRCLARINEKLQGFESQFSGGDVALSAEDQVNLVIDAACDPANLSRIFYGWSPWL